MMRTLVKLCVVAQTLLLAGCCWSGSRESENGLLGSLELRSDVIAIDFTEGEPVYYKRTFLGIKAMIARLSELEVPESLIESPEVYALPNLAFKEVNGCPIPVPSGIAEGERCTVHITAYGKTARQELFMIWLSAL